MANQANILLHGLFFLQYQGDQLIVLAPYHKKHEFKKRPQHQQPPLDPLNDEEAFANLIPHNIKQAFPPSMPQFDKNETGVGDLVPKQKPEKNYRCQMVLPWPLDIDVIRTRGRMRDLKPMLTSRVGDNILKYSGPGLGLVTVLHYETPDPGFTISCFAEHMKPANTNEVNDALKDAGKLFANESKFDLRLREVNRPIICPDPDPLPPKITRYQIIRDDEHSVGEVYDSKDCAGIVLSSKITGDKVIRDDEPPAGEVYKTKNRLKTFASDPANCVQFGVRG